MKNPESLAKEMSQFLPTFIRHMYPYLFEPIDVPPSQVLALVTLYERGGCTMSQLKDELHVSAPTVTGIVDRLVRVSYVRREEDTKDRRVKNVYLTERGKDIVNQFRENIRKRWEYILSQKPDALEGMAAAMTTMKGITKGFQDGTI